MRDFRLSPRGALTGMHLSVFAAPRSLKMRY